MKKSSFKRIVTALFSMLVVLCLLSSCGAGKAEFEDMTSYPQYNKEFDYGYSSGGSYSEKTEEYDDNIQLETPNGGSDSAETYSEKIIRNVKMVAETREFDLVLAEMRLTVTQLMGGYEESVNIVGRSYNSSDTYRRSANLVFRIPAENLDAFLSNVKGYINVVNQTSESTNVTTQYYDIQSRISVLESEKMAYEEMLQKAADVDQLLKIKDRLYDVIAEIESYETQIRMYDSKVSYSTVSMRLDEVVEYSQIVTPEDTFGTRVGKAFTESWRDFADGFQNFTVWLVYAFPTLLILATVAGAIVFLILISRRAKKRAKDEENSRR